MWTPGSGGGSGGGSGDVAGPASSTDNAVVRFDGAGGKTLQNSIVIINDAGSVSGVTSLGTANVSIGASTIAVASVGDNKARATATGLELASDAQLKWFDNIDIASGSADVGLERVSAGVIEVTNGSTGSGQLNVGANTKLTTTQVIAPAGSAATPGLTGAGDLDTGLVWPGSNQLQLSFEGAVQMQAAYNYLWLQRDDGVVALGSGMDAGLGWLAAAVLRATAGQSGLGALSAGQWVLPRTADLTLTSAHSGALITNTGAAGQVILTLPAATLTNGVGPSYLFTVRAAQNIRIVAAGTDVINLAAAASAAGGRIDSNTVRSSIHLFVSEAGFWDSIASGTWTAT